MSGLTITQEELDKMIMVERESRKKAAAEKPKLKFSYAAAKEEFATDKSEIARLLREKHILLTQEEVDRLFP